jgi:hypothetical protein
MQFAISGVTLYLAYKMIAPRIAAQPVPPVVVQRHLPERKARPQRIEAPPKRRLVPQDVPLAPTAVPVQSEAPAPPALEFPKFVSLPSLSEDRVTPLVELPDGVFKLALLTNCSALRLDGNRLRFIAGDEAQGLTIAGLRIEQRRVEFRWTASAIEEAESELRNAVLVLTTGGQRHAMALRAPQVVEAPVLDLTKSVFRLASVTDHPPDPLHIRFDLKPAALWPTFLHDGDALLGMKIGNSAMLRYTIAEGAATEVRAVPSGNTMAVRLDTRYVLPSGDIEPLSISRGNRKRDRLLGLLDEAEAAPAELSDLRSVASRCQYEIRLAQNADTWTYVNGIHIQDTVRVAAVNQAISQASARLNAATSRGQYLEDLLANAPAIREDVRVLEKIVDLSKNLREQKLHYRFYTLVGGEQVDLVIAE